MRGIASAESTSLVLKAVAVHAKGAISEGEHDRHSAGPGDEAVHWAHTGAGFDLCAGRYSSARTQDGREGEQETCL